VADTHQFDSLKALCHTEEQNEFDSIAEFLDSEEFERASLEFILN